MKRAIVALAVLMATIGSYGQGTVQFNNRLPASGIDDCPTVTVQVRRRSLLILVFIFVLVGWADQAGD